MKSLVFPRIFLHCVALGFIVSGLLLSGRPPVRIWPGVPYKTPQDGEFPHPAVFFAVWGAFLKKMTKICEKRPYAFSAAVL